MNDLQEKLLNKCSVSENNCWEWQGANRKGYGCLKLDGKTKDAHRLSFTIHKGDIPEGYMVCHHCDNPSCINPDHLFTGTASDNSKDAVKKGRIRVPEGNLFKPGHKPPQRSLTDKQAKKIKKDIQRFYPAIKTLKEIAEMNNVPSQRIKDMRRTTPRSYFNVSIT